MMIDRYVCFDFFYEFSFMKKSVDKSIESNTIMNLSSKLLGEQIFCDFITYPHFDLTPVTPLLYPIPSPQRRGYGVIIVVMFILKVGRSLTFEKCDWLTIYTTYSRQSHYMVLIFFKYVVPMVQCI